MPVTVRVRQKPIKLEVDADPGVRAAGAELADAIDQNIARGGGLSPPKDGGRALHRSEQLARSVEQVEKHSSSGTVVTVGPTGERSGTGGARTNAEVAVILETTKGAKIGVTRADIARAYEAARARIKARLVVG